VDPENGDYRVKESSPALELGFENFPMDNFGVTDPVLRAQARTPNVGGGRGDAFQSDRDETVHDWRGAKIKNIAGLGERSSVGLARDIGVRLLKVPEGSAAAKVGLREDDVILGYNGQSVKNVEDLLALDKDHMERIDVLRNQRRVRLESKDGDDNAQSTSIPE
jgi:S1-C subfamily serine protease